MTCLNDSHIQALADGERDDEAARHASACAHCAGRLRERERTMAAIRQSIDVPVGVPAPLARSVEEIFRRKAEATRTRNGAVDASEARGATRLLPTHSRGFRLPWAELGRGQAEGRRRWVYSGIAVAAATLVAVLFIAPMAKGPATVSAAEILAKSATRLATPLASGVEFLEYELVLDGVPRDVMPDQADGAYRVKQVIDHTVAGRFRVTSYGPGGVPLSSIAQDPATGRRVMAFRLDDQPYRFEFTLPAVPPMSLPEMERLHMQASVAMMQASGNQHLQILETPDGTQYRIDVPRVSAATPSAVWDLSEAHVIVDANDFHVVELAVKGAFLKQPYSFSYRLIARDVVSPAAVPAGTFDVPAEPGAITLGGEGSPIPARDAFVAALRALARSTQVR
jgi:hypothetical protein